MYAALAEYKRVHGDCNVPYDWSENPYLGRWIRKQRHARKANGLEQDRIEQLDKLGFAWDYLEYQWESKYSALVKFRKEYGHCRVSTLSKTHAALANWVRTHAGEKKAGQAECGTNPAARLAGVYLGHVNGAIPTHRKRAEDRRAREAEPFQTPERLASAICRLRYAAGPGS